MFKLIKPSTITNFDELNHFRNFGHVINTISPNLAISGYISGFRAIHFSEEFYKNRMICFRTMIVPEFTEQFLSTSVPGLPFRVSFEREEALGRG